jgi:SAM-dependent methyltransferase
MTVNSPPSRCLLCDSPRSSVSACFVQRYPQHDGSNLPVDWWECPDCRGWYACPIPSAEKIRSYWATVSYVDPGHEQDYAESKRAIRSRILAGLLRHIGPGSLLDVGCNFGVFLDDAQAAGWKVVGVEPNDDAVRIARDRGFSVKQGWFADECGLADASFQAVVLNDVFCYSWHPFRDLKTFHRLLTPGGVLALRITNKHWILRFSRAIASRGDRRDSLLTTILLSQFHSISVQALKQILIRIGFDRIEVESQASTAPFPSMSWCSRAAYIGADIVRRLTLGQTDLSPGVLLFARKAVSPSEGHA